MSKEVNIPGEQVRLELPDEQSAADSGILRLPNGRVYHYEGIFGSSPKFTLIKGSGIITEKGIVPLPKISWLQRYDSEKFLWECVGKEVVFLYKKGKETTTYSGILKYSHDRSRFDIGSHCFRIEEFDTIELVNGVICITETYCKDSRIC